MKNQGKRGAKGDPKDNKRKLSPEKKKRLEQFMRKQKKRMKEYAQAKKMGNKYLKLDPDKNIGGGTFTQSDKKARKRMYKN